jgi:hypothetical protein
MATIRLKLDGLENSQGILFGGFLLALREPRNGSVSFWPGVRIEVGGFAYPSEGTLLLDWIPGTVLLFEYPGEVEAVTAFLGRLPEFAGLAKVLPEGVLTRKEPCFVATAGNPGSAPNQCDRG